MRNSAGQELLRPITRAWAAILLLALAACDHSNSLISPNELIPVGVTEAAVPQDFVDAILTAPDLTGQRWVRGFTTAGQWDQVASEVEGHALAHGYYAVRPAPNAALDAAKLNYDDIMRYYQSPDKTLLVGVVNLRFFRLKGAKIDGTADYMLFGGPDRTPYALK